LKGEKREREREKDEETGREGKEKVRGIERDRESDRGGTFSKKIYVGIYKLPTVGSFSKLGRLSIVTQ